MANLAKMIDYLKQHKYQTLFCTGMMNSYLFLQKKKRIVFFSVHFFQFIVYGKTHKTKLLRLFSWVC